MRHDTRLVGLLNWTLRLRNEPAILGGMADTIQRRLSFLKELLGPLEYRLPTPLWEAIAAEMDAIERDACELSTTLADWQSVYQTLRDMAEGGDSPSGGHRLLDSQREAG